MSDVAKTAIKQLLSRPKSLTTDGGSVSEIDISQAIAADKHLAKDEVKNSRRMGIRMGILRAPRQF